MLSVLEIEKQYRTVKAVDRLSFHVRRGEIFALLGPNGAGKTTTVRMLNGIVRPDRGSIAYELDGVATPTPPASAIGYLPEDRGLYKEVAVIRTLVYFGVLRGLRRRDAKRAAREWLERLGLWERANEKLDALSKGNQQKVQFISAILHRPRFAILDEPFSGLDPLNQDMFIDLLRELRDAGMTILLSAHQMQLVERIADRILLVDIGKEILHGTLEELRSRSRAATRLTLRLNEEADLSALEAHPAVEQIRSTAEQEVVLLVRGDRPLGDLLVMLGSTLDVAAIRSEQLSLHDIFVQAVDRSFAKPAVGEADQ